MAVGRRCRPKSMAVEAQHPSNLVPSTEIHNRVWEIGTSDNHNMISVMPVVTSGALDELFRLQPTAVNTLFYNPGLVNQSIPLCAATLDELENNFASRSRKRPREDKSILARDNFLLALPYLQQHQNNTSCACATVGPQTVAPNFAGLRLLPDGPVMAFPPSKNNTSSSFSSILMGALKSETMRQKDEVNLLIDIQAETLKRVLVEKSERHTRCLVEAIEKGFLKSLKKKQLNIEKVKGRNLELEDCVKQLRLEAQLWQNMAENNEALVSNLRTSLEQVIEVEDAESCHYGETGDDYAKTFRENTELKEQRTCKACRRADLCILLLPCKHLCLCKDCESRLDTCPVCMVRKNASLQVYMS